LKNGTFTLEDLKNDIDFKNHLAERDNKEDSSSKVETVDVDSASPQDLIDSGFNTIETEVKTELLQKDIRNFIGAMSGDTSKGVFITTSSFDIGAIKKAREAHHSIILIDGVKLVDLMHQYDVGVQTKTVYEVKELDNDFFEGE